MRKIIGLIAIFAIMTMVVSACGKDKANDSSPETSAASPGETSGSPNKESDSPQKKTTIKFMLWSNGPQDKEIWDELAAEFHAANPNYSVTTELLDSKQYDQVYKARLAAGEGPDIFGIRPQDMPSFVKGGFLLELIDQEWFNSLYPEAQKAFTVDGKAVGVPMAQSGNGILYNKKLFEENQIAVPRTWDELLAASQQLKDKGIIPFAMSAKDSWWTQFILFYATAEHVDAQDPSFNEKVKNGEADFSSNSGWMEAINVYKTLLDKQYFVPNPLGVGADQAKALFMQGKAAMYPATFGLQEAEDAKIDVGYMNFPTTNDQNMAYQWGGYSFGLSLNAKNKENMDAANAFMSFVLEPSNYHKMLATYKYFPVKDGVDVSDVHPLFGVMQQEWKGKTMVGSPPDGWLPGVQDAMLNGIQELTAGRIDVQEVLNRMTAANKKALDAK